MSFGKRAVTCVGGMLFASVFSVAFAEEWSITPSLSVIETYTDNLNLSPQGQETDSVISQINPAILIKGEGRRLSLDGAYRMQNLFYSNDSSLDNTKHQFGAGLKSELIEDWFYFDAFGQLTQQLIDPSTGIADT